MTSHRFSTVLATGARSAQSPTLASARWRLLSLLLACAWLVVPGPAQASPEALQVLLGGAPAGAPGAAQPAAGGGWPPALAASARPQVTVRSGQTLQDLIRRHLRDTPYSEAFLRQAVMQLNPTAFAGGSPHRLHAGAVLQLPTLHDLRLLADGVAPGAAPATAALQGTASAHASSPEDRKQWIRFP